MSKLLQALLHLDQNVAPIVAPLQPAPATEKREPAAAKAKPTAEQSAGKKPTFDPTATLQLPVLAPKIETRRPLVVSTLPMTPASTPVTDLLGTTSVLAISSPAVFPTERFGDAERFGDSEPRAQRSRAATSERPVKPLATRTAPLAALAEDYRDLARRLRLKLEPPATLFVAHAGPILSDAWLIPLAVALAGDQEVPLLLVEARPDYAELAASFGISADRGLRESLIETADWSSVVRPTAIANLDVLAVGHAPWALPTRLADRLSALAGQWKRKFGWTIVSGGDATNIHAAAAASACDAALLVVSLSATRQEEASRAHANLESLGGRVLGAVVC